MVCAQVGQLVVHRSGAVALRTRIAGDSNETVRRIEDWIVSALGSDEPSAIDSELQDLIVRIAPGRRGRRSKSGSSQSRNDWARFQLVRRRGITVVMLTDKALIKEPELSELAGDLLALVEAGHHRMVLNFIRVERLSSWAVGPVAEAIKVCAQARGGALRVCGLNPQVDSIFALTGLGRDVAIFPDENSAIDGPWPEAPDLKPLPVAVLMSLTRAMDISSRETMLPSRLIPPDRDLAIAPTCPSPREGFPPMSGAQLIVQVGPLKGQAVVVDRACFLIGRDTQCHLRPSSPTVSRRHASLESRGSALYLRDLGSTNGTILNGRLLKGSEAELRDNDQIAIGPLRFKLLLSAGQRTREPGVEDEVANWLHDDEPRPPALGLEPAPDNARGATETMEATLQFKHEVIEDVLVVTPLVPEVDDNPTIDRFRELLISLFEQRLPLQVVVNLTHVAHISGRAIGMLVAHYLKLDRAGGALRVCQANPRVASLLEQIRLEQLVECHPSVDDAILLAWPEASGNRENAIG